MLKENLTQERARERERERALKLQLQETHHIQRTRNVWERERRRVVFFSLSLTHPYFVSLSISLIDNPQATMPVKGDIFSRPKAFFLFSLYLISLFLSLVKRVTFFFTTIIVIINREMMDLQSSSLIPKLTSSSSSNKSVKSSAPDQ